MTFRHASVGTSCRSTIASSSRLLLPVITSVLGAVSEPILERWFARLSGRRRTRAKLLLCRWLNAMCSTNAPSSGAFLGAASQWNTRACRKCFTKPYRRDRHSRRLNRAHESRTTFADPLDVPCCRRSRSMALYWHVFVCVMGEEKPTAMIQRKPGKRVSGIRKE